MAEPQRFDAAKATAAIIFLHGLGDTSDGWTKQFRSANKLPHVSWIFPNAPRNHEAMTTAWYPPEPFSPIPVGRSSDGSRVQESDSTPDVMAAIFDSAESLCKLIDAEVAAGIPAERVVVAGFSQGCVMGLVAGLTTRYAGKLGGVIGLSGYLPHSPLLEERIACKDERTPVFLGHGKRDMAVPVRMYRDAKERLEAVFGDAVEGHLYEGLGHSVSGEELGDICAFLEKVIP